MKKIVCTLAITCGLISAANAQDKKQETIEGNGKLETKNVSVKSFDALSASGIFELKMSQGSAESVKLEGDENLLEYIAVHNDGSKLVIDMDKLKNKNVNFKTKNKLKVYVTFRKLKNMDLSMVGNVNSNDQLAFDDLDINNKGVGNLDLNLSANSVSLKNKGVGNVTLSGKANSATIMNTGVGSLKAGNFAVQSMNIENTGVGSAEINAEKDVKVRSSGIGSVKNKGAAPMPRKNRASVVI